jgi:hypothetical protein
MPVFGPSDPYSPEFRRFLAPALEYVVRPQYAGLDVDDEYLYDVALMQFADVMGIGFWTCLPEESKPERWESVEGAAGRVFVLPRAVGRVAMREGES